MELVHVFPMNPSLQSVEVRILYEKQVTFGQQ